MILCLLPIPESNADDIWVCQQCDWWMTPNRKTIQEAISLAETGDVIKIRAEPDPENEDVIMTYAEVQPLVIDNQLTITSPWEHAYGWPVVTVSNFLQDDDVFTITSSGAGTVISNLEIRGTIGNNTVIPGYDPIECMDQRVGIRLEANDCLIDNCRITFCMTGIYMESSTGAGGLGNIISNCRIGDQWWSEPFPGSFDYEEYWKLYHDVEEIDHPGNGFGIVLAAPDWDPAPGEVYEDLPQNEIVDCTIRSNRYYGVVLTNGSQAHVAHNIIAWNGDLDATISDTVPDETGGLLSLFTADQIQNNDNKLQAPTILSNSIYGNKGYQVGVFTECDNYFHIYNSPILIANNIGIEEDFPVPGGEHDDYCFLLCCGPTPAGVAPTPTAPPDTPTYTPCVPGQFDYDYHGSGPILAWNNFHDTSNMGLDIYHPMQRQSLPPRHTFTPTPTPTPTGGSPTPLPTLPTYPPTTKPCILQFSPTPVPWIPTATPETPVPTSTPNPKAYRIADQAWTLRGLKANPRHDGYKTDPARIPPRYYDWHLRDYDTDNPSHCFDKGGLVLNPGSGRTDMTQDTDFIDMGMHQKNAVPTVENLTIEPYRNVYILTWSRPGYWPDGSLFELSDIGGYVVLYGVLKPGTETIQIVGEPVFLPSNSTSYKTDAMTIVEPTHFGVYIYDVQGLESEIAWKEISDS